MAILESLLFIFLSLCVGVLVLSWLDREKKLRLEEIFAGALVLGFTISGFLVLILALGFRDLRLALFLGEGLVLLALLAFRRRFSGILSGERLLRFRFGWHQILLVLFLAVYFVILWQVMIWLPLENGDSRSVPASVLVGWGDGAYHSNIISLLATSEPFRLQQPIAAGEPLTYPFLFDFTSAIFEKIGIPSPWAWHLAPFIFGTSLFFLVYFFGKRLFENNWWAVGLLFLIFFGSGLGFWWFFQDLGSAWQNSGFSGVGETLLHPPHEYTHLDIRTGGKPSSFDLPENIVWMVPMVSFFSHQRSFILGAGLSILFFFGFFLYRENLKIFYPWFIILGLLPLVHTHSFFAVSVITAVFFLQTLFRKGFPLSLWLRGFLIVGILALPQVLFLSQAGFLSEGRGTNFFRPWFGWMMCTHNFSWLFCDPGVAGVDSNIIWFWLKNFGLVFLFWLLFIFFGKKYSATADILRLPSLVMFFLPNLLLFQPWEFDNNKALFYWWFLASILSLFFLKMVQREGRFLSRFLVLLFFLGAGLAGGVDVFARVVNVNQPHFRYYGASEFEISRWIKENTSSSAVFLTSQGANQFVPMLTGRPIYLGFTGWLWTQGRSELILERQRKIQNFLIQANPRELCEDNVSFWLSEPAFFATYPIISENLEERVGEVVFTHPSGRKIVKLGCF